MYAIQIRNKDKKQAEHALRRFQLPRNYRVLTGHSVLFQFTARRGQPEDMCFRCQKGELCSYHDGNCLFTGKRCPVEFVIDEVILAFEALLVSGVKARIQI